MEKPQTAQVAEWSERLRMLGIGVLSGLAVGFVAAIAARIIMRFIALALGNPSMFTVANLALIRTGLYDGVLMGLLFVAICTYLPGGRIVKGLVFGVLLLALASLPFVLPFVGELQGSPALGTGLFAALFLATGIAESLAVAYLEKRLPTPRRHLLSLLGYGAMFALAAYTVLSFIIGMVILFAHWLGSFFEGAAQNIGASLI